MSDERREDDRLAFAAAREVVRRRSMDFYLACSFLPRPKRDSVYAACAFCSMIEQAMNAPDQDESIRCSSDSTDGRILLLREKLGEIYQSRLELPQPQFRSPDQHVLYAILQTIHRFEIPRDLFLDLANALLTMSKQSRIATWNSLEKCLRAGAAVAQILSCILGATHSDAPLFAAKMGMAIQFSEILNNLRSDLAKDRIWLPLEDLARFKFSQRELSNAIINENFRQLIQFEIDRARNLFAESAEGICWLAGDGSRVMASTVTILGCGMLDAIERRNGDLFSGRAKLSLALKLSRLPRAWRLARRQSDDPMPRVF